MLSIPPTLFFWVHSMWDLSPWPEIKPVLSEVEAQSLNSSPPGKSLNSFLQAPIISLPTSLRSHLSSHLPTELWTVRQNSCHMRHLWLSTAPSTYQRVIYRECVEYRVWVISWVNAIPETLRHETKDWNAEMEGNRAARGIIYGGVEIDYLGLETWWRACREDKKEEIRKEEISTMVAGKNHGWPTQVQRRKRQNYGTLSTLSWNSHSCVTQVCVQSPCFADGFMVGAGGEEAVRGARMEKQCWSKNEVKSMRIKRPCPSGVIASGGLGSKNTLLLS